jgi:hypothetical protein
MDSQALMDKGKFLVASMISAILLVAMLQAGTNYVLAQPTETGEQSTETGEQSTETGEDTSSASQDYQEFQSCLSDAEVDGTVSEQQIRDCFAPIYNTGTATGTGTTTSSDSPAGDEDITSADDTSGEGEEGEEASE